MFVLLRMHFGDLSVHNFRFISLLLDKLISFRFCVEHDLMTDTSRYGSHAHLCLINRALALRWVIENILLLGFLLS